MDNQNSQHYSSYTWEGEGYSDRGAALREVNRVISSHSEGVSDYGVKAVFTTTVTDGRVDNLGRCIPDSVTHGAAYVPFVTYLTPHDC
jgi:hypothetical protein